MEYIYFQTEEPNISSSILELTITSLNF